MSTTAENNKRIAKNAILLYIRMFFIMVVGLFTSRVVINTLGISDYGIYNVVGGVVVMLSFLNSSMSAASQRFFSFELGRGNKARLKQVFSTSLITHYAVAGILFIIAETIGLWFLNSHMNIEESRMIAANWVYQCSILSFMISIISVPFNACIIAYEHMKAYAYISIVEVVLKLIIVYLLLIIQGDKLIIFAILLLGISVIIQISYSLYCKYHFEECVGKLAFNRVLFNEMFSFVGWNVLGTSSFAFKDQGVNIILNLFFGTSVNAARGIAMQVNGIVNNFTNNFLMALRPQITKQYAEGNVSRSVSLVYAGCRYSAYLVLIIAIPFMINIDYILRLWLGVVPQYTSLFLQIILISTLFRTMQLPLISAIHATGRIRFSQIIVSVVNFLEVPGAYLILKKGAAPYMAMCPTVLVALIGLNVYIFSLRKLVSNYDVKYFVDNIVLRISIISLLCYFLSKYMYDLFIEGILSCIITSGIAILITGSVIYFIGITTEERKLVKVKAEILFQRIVRNKRKNNI